MAETPERVLARVRTLVGTTGIQSSNAAIVRLVLRRLLFDGCGVPAWRTHDACRAMPPDAFYPDLADRNSTDAAKRVCRGCPVRVECLTDALGWERGQRHGIAGGLTPHERRRLVVRLRHCQREGGAAA
ncbi:MAG: hypothetical protein GEU83_09155 [Pseudonocardiaceae bacterium]|nr:hypothetical protein [Pseudonocardiaceae bacterium]